MGTPLRPSLKGHSCQLLRDFQSSLHQAPRQAQWVPWEVEAPGGLHLLDLGLQHPAWCRQSEHQRSEHKSSPRLSLFLVHFSSPKLLTAESLVARNSLWAAYLQRPRPRARPTVPGGREGEYAGVCPQAMGVSDHSLKSTSLIISAPSPQH